MAGDEESPQDAPQKLSKTASKPSSPGATPRFYEFGLFRIDVRRRRLLRSGEPVSLAPKAFDTLLVLVEESGVVIEKDDLMRRVWPDVVVEEANLTQNIFTIRKALGATSADHDYIMTVPRRGYRFAPEVKRVYRDEGLDDQRSESATRGTRYFWVPWAEAFGAVVVAFAFLRFIGVFGVGSRVEPIQKAVVRFAVPLPDGVSFPRAVPTIAISHDGRQLVFAGERPGIGSRLFVRSLDSSVVRELPGSDDANNPFWSSDDRFVGFFANGKLKTLSLADGVTQTVADALVSWGGAWGRDHVIVYSRGPGFGLWKVSAFGGAPMRMTEPNPGLGDLHAWPSFLPDGRRFLYLNRSGSDASGIYMGSLDSEKTTFLVKARSSATYASGYLLFVRDGSLVAVAFDDRSDHVGGESIAVADEVANNIITGKAAFAASPAGVLAYRRKPSARNGQLVSLARDGSGQRSVAAPGPFYSPSLSPDGRRIAVTRFAPTEQTADIWIIERTGGASRFTTHAASEFDPIWSPDGHEIVFASDRTGPFELYRRSTIAQGEDELLFATGTSKFPASWSADGQIIVFEVDGGKTGKDLWTARRSDRRPVRYLETPFNEEKGALSPDARWMAYQSDESGTWEVYVRPFPSAAGAKTMLSSAGGTRPRWRQDGKEVYYLARDGKLMVVQLRVGTSAGGEPMLEAGVPRVLFTAPTSPERANYEGDYAVDGGGQRFVFHMPTRFAAGPSQQQTPPAIDVVINWAAALTRSPSRSAHK